MKIKNDHVTQWLELAISNCLKRKNPIKLIRINRNQQKYFNQIIRDKT